MNIEMDGMALGGCAVTIRSVMVLSFFATSLRYGLFNAILVSVRVLILI